MMINWLALTNQEVRPFILISGYPKTMPSCFQSRTILLESSCATKESMELDVALEMLVKMGITDKRSTGSPRIGKIFSGPLCYHAFRSNQTFSASDQCSAKAFVELF